VNPFSTTYTSLQNINPALVAAGGGGQPSQRPFWYDQDDGSVRKLREVDPANEVFQRWLEASMANNLPSYPLDSPFNQVAHYRNTVFVAIQGLMNALSASNILLEMREKGMGIAAGGSYAKDQEYVPFDDHQLSDYLRSPNPVDSFSSFLGQVVLQYSLTGQVLIWGVPNEWGLPVRFYVLPTALCTPAYGCNSQMYPIGAWRIQQYYPATGLIGVMAGPVAGMAATPGALIDAREVYVLKNPHPLYKWACISGMTGVNVNVDIIEMIDRSAWSIYRNGPSPKGIVTAPGAGKGQVDDLEARINDKYAGPDNAGKVWVLGGHPDSRGPSYTPLTPSPDTMAYDTRAIYEALVIAGVTGQDSAVLGLRSGGSYSDRWAAMKDVRVRTYEPLLGRIADLFTHGPVRQWGLTKKGVRAAIRLPRLDDPVMSQADTNAGAADGTLSTNEIRSRRGLGPDELGLGHLPAPVRMMALQMQLEGGAIPPNPNPMANVVAEEPDIPSDNTALGALREGIELPDVEPVVGQNMDATGSLGRRTDTKPRQPSSRAKGKKDNKKKEKKALDEDQLEVLLEYLARNPTDATALEIYREYKSMEAVTGLDQAGSLVPPPVQGPLPKKKKKKLPVSKIVDEVLGTSPVIDEIVASVKAVGDEDVEIKAEHITKSPAFKAWFGDWENDPKNSSKVVSKRGRPMVVYHGTNQNFDTFEAGEFGFHVGDKAAAEMLGTPLKLHVNIRNPLRMRDLGVWTPDRVLDTPAVRTRFTPEEISSVRAASAQLREHHAAALDQDDDIVASGKAHYEWSRPVRELLKSKGYDGIVYRNEAEGFADSHIAFDPHQLKLAHGNKTYSSEDASFRKSYFESYEDIETKGEFNRYDVSRHHLANAPIISADPIGKHNVNQAFHVIMDHPRVHLQGVFKPESGEYHHTDLHLPGGFHSRESATSHVAEIMGVHDLVPPTTIRTHDGEKGSIQRFIPGARSGYEIAESDPALYGSDHHNLRRAAAFDYLIGNVDRHPGNWMIKRTPDKKNKLVLIDHGNTFPEGSHYENMGNYELFREAARKDRASGIKAPTLVTSSYDADNKWAAIHKTLKAHGLGEKAITHTRQRFGILTSGKHTLNNLLYTHPDDLEGM
jgi:hypothetical protein